MTSEELSKKEKTEQRRAKATARINAEKARARRRGRLIRISVVLAAVAVAAAVAALMITGKPVEIPSTGPVPAAGNVYGGVNTESAETTAKTVDVGAIPESDGEAPAGITVPGPEDPASVVVYLDANCVHCAEFEGAYGEVLKQKAEAGEITLETRAIAILDRNSPTNYSSRAANAMACVADAEPARYLDFTAALFARYSSGELPNQGLIDLAADQGVTGIDDCIKDGAFRPFVKFTTAAAAEHGITGTPTVFVNGKMWDLTGDLEDVLTEASA
ncbi:DsbA family protein [Arthrobacter sp. IK3]|uniref:DsbA family protein n=1 Tax=Arthrobacter sp. IK3 TaxID=3448169 RepID=UPI003EDE7DF5